MITFRQVSIKNRPYSFFNSMINIKNFDPSLLRIDQVSFKKSTDCVLYDIEYFKNLFILFSIM